MALQYLLDPQLQYSEKSGALSVAGFLRVYLNGTDDLAVTYKDFNGTLNTADIVLDDNGRAVVIADSSKTYRLEVYNRLGGLMWTQYPLNTIAGGAGGADGIVVESTDGSIQVDKYNAGGLVHFDLSTEGAQELEWTRTDNALIEESAEGVFLLPVNQVEGNMTVDCTGILLKADVHYDVSMFINIEAPSTVVNRFEGLQFRVGGPDAPVAAVTFDNSYAHRQVACLSCDVHPQADTRLRVYVEGLANGAVLSCSQCTVHSLAATYTTGSEYTAGEGINIESKVISVDPAVVQHTLVPGQGIDITNNVISATGGGSGGVFVLHYDGDMSHTDEYLEAIKDAIDEDKTVVLYDELNHLFANFIGYVPDYITGGIEKAVFVCPYCASKGAPSQLGGSSAPVTYIYGIKGSSDPIPVNVAQGVELPYYSDSDTGKGLVLVRNSIGGTVVPKWVTLQDTPLIDIRYRNGQLSDDINTIWEKALKYVYEGRTPILHADFNGDSLNGDLYAGRTRLICSATNLYTQNWLDAAYGYMRFTGLDTWEAAPGYLLSSYRIVGQLEKSSANSTPTITWFKSPTVDNLTAWTP